MASHAKHPCSAQRGREARGTKGVTEEMLRLNRTFKVVLPLLLVTTVPTAYPQSAPAKVKVGDVEYSVTPMSRGRMLRIDDLAGHMIGMASVNGANVSVLAPQQEPGFSGVRNAATEYLHPTNGGATAPANTPPPRLPRLRPWMILTRRRGKLNLPDWQT